jgi:hypothetical protein
MTLFLVYRLLGKIFNRLIENCLSYRMICMVDYDNSRGTIDEKIHFIFDMYNVSHDNKISKQELATLLNHIPKEVLHAHDNLNFNGASMLMNRSQQNLSSHPSRQALHQDGHESGNESDGTHDADGFYNRNGPLGKIPRPVGRRKSSLIWRCYEWVNRSIRD